MYYMYMSMYVSKYTNLVSKSVSQYAIKVVSESSMRACMHVSQDINSPRQHHERLAIRVQVSLKACQNPPLQAGARKRQQ